MGANAQTTVPKYTALTVLPAASMNISAGTGIPVFASTVTRDAAFGGANKVLAEGQTCYLEDANVVQFYDGAAWATVGPSAGGLAAIVPTSVTLGSGSSTTSANGTVTFSGASAVALNGVFSATYDTYRILLKVNSASGTANVAWRLRAAGVDAAAAGTYKTLDIFNSSTVAVAADTGSYTSGFIIQQINATYPTYAAAWQDFYNPFGAAVTTEQHQSADLTAAAAYQIFQGNCFHTPATSYDGIDYIASAGTFGGTISVYGYAK